VDSEINFTIPSEMGDAATPEVPEYVESAASLFCQCLLSNPLPAVDLPLKAEMEAYKPSVSRLSLLFDRNEGMSRLLNLNVLCTVVVFISDLFLRAMETLCLCKWHYIESPSGKTRFI